MSGDGSASRHTQPRDDEEHAERAFRTPPTVAFDSNDVPGWTAQMESLLDYGQLWEFVRPLSAAEVAREAQQATSSGSSVTSGASRTQAKRREAFFILCSALKDPESRRVLVGLQSERDPRARRMGGDAKACTAKTLSRSPLCAPRAAHSKRNAHAPLP